MRWDWIIGGNVRRNALVPTFVGRTAGLMTGATLSVVLATVEAVAAARPWTLQDSISVNYVALMPSFADIRVRTRSLEDAPTFVASPDGEFFFFANNWGELEGDADVTSISVYRTRSVLEALSRSASGPLPPYRFVAIRSRHADSSVADLKWDIDGRAVLFLGYPDVGISQGYRLDIRSGALEQLTETPSLSRSIRWMVARGEGILYAEEHRAPRVPARYPAEWVERRADGTFVPGEMLRGPSQIALYMTFRGKRHSVATNLGTNLFSNWIWLSPDGSRAIAMMLEPRGQAPFLQRFVYFDLERASVNVLPDIEGGSHGAYLGSTTLRPKPTVLWSEDGTRAIIVNTVTSQPKGGISSTRGEVDAQEAKIDEAGTEIGGTEGARSGGTAAMDGRKPDPGQLAAAGLEAEGAASNRGAAQQAKSLVATAADRAPHVRATDEGDVAARQFIIEYEVSSGRWRALEPFLSTAGGVARYVKSVDWLKPGREVLVTHEEAGRQSDGTVYTFAASGVERVSVSASVVPPPNTALVGGLTVRLEQSPNDPPQVIASDGQREMVLTAPDPALQRVQRQRTEPFSWPESDGRLVSGGLTLPPGFRKGQPVPLVIYPYQYTPDLFLPDGMNRSSDAAQALAARGMAALQVEMFLPMPGQTSLKDGPTNLARIEAVVTELVRQGIADPARIGMTGFSHAGMETLYVITHPGKVRLAAAMGSDFFTGGYPEYLRDIMRYSSDVARRNYELTPEGSFWEKKSQWLEHDPTFNADRVVTPFLITRHQFAGVDERPVRTEDDYFLGLLGAFVRNDKPVDYLYLGYSNHGLTRPLTRLASTEAMLDWMSFWLQDYEDPSPHKARQYQRWRPMREQQAKSLARAQARGQFRTR